MRRIVGADLVDARPARLVRGRRRRDTSDQRGEASTSFAWPEMVGGDGGIDLVVEDALPHRAVAGELHQLDVAFSSDPAKASTARAFVVQRRRSDHHAHALAPQTLHFLAPPVSFGHAPSETALQSVEARISRSGCAPPFLHPPNSSTPSCAKYTPDAHHRVPVRARSLSGARRATSLPAGSTRNIGAVFVLNALAHRDRDVEARTNRCRRRSGSGSTVFSPSCANAGTASAQAAAAVSANTLRR